MTIALAPGAKALPLDFKKSLLQSYAVKEKTNQLLLNNISEEAGRPNLPLEKAAASRTSPLTFTTCD